MSEKLLFMVDRLVGSTDNQWGFEMDDCVVWLPKSEVEYDEEAGTVLVPEWLAINEELV